LTVKESVFVGNTATIQGGAFYNYMDSFYDVSITDSCIVGNSNTAFFNEPTVGLIATGNWWGDPAGPGGYGPGSGDSVSDHITFDPWLYAPPAICAP